jgi:5-methylcytosine-specific restriction endonuclease McrA
VPNLPGSQIDKIAEGDEGKAFYLKRFLYQRLRGKEVKDKNVVRDEIWESGARECGKCGKEYGEPTGLAVHRKDSSKPYSLSNCVVMCIECHRKEHSKKD